MGRTIPTTEPDVVVAGDTWGWTKSLPDYPSSGGWTLGYAIRGASVLQDSAVQVSGVGAAYSITVAAAATKPLKPGKYRWQSYVDNAATGEHYTIDTGVVTVLAGLTLIDDASAQTHDERMVAAIQRELEARVTGSGNAHDAIAINGRSLSKIATDKLMRMLAVYQWKVARQGKTGDIGAPVRTVMTSPDNAFGGPEPVVLPPWYSPFTQGRLS